MLPRLSAFVGRALAAGAAPRAGAALESATGRGRLLATGSEASSSGTGAASSAAASSSNGAAPRSLLDSAQMLNGQPGPGSVHQARRLAVLLLLCFAIVQGMGWLLLALFVLATAA